MDMHFLASRRCSWGDSSRSASAMLREDGAAPGVVPGAVVPGEPKLRPRFVPPTPRLPVPVVLPRPKVEVKFVLELPVVVPEDELAVMPLPEPMLNPPLFVVPEGPLAEPPALALPPPIDPPTLPLFPPE